MMQFILVIMQLAAYSFGCSLLSIHLCAFMFKIQLVAALYAGFLQGDDHFYQISQRGPIHVMYDYDDD
jgi:hypothetical protein